MRTNDVMTPNPACCRPETPLEEVAALMLENDCGEIPVVDSLGRPIGVVTDRDICCRVVARGMSPSDLDASDCMTTPCITIQNNATIDDCVRLLEEHMIRRVPVVDDTGRCCGIVSQADVAQCVDADLTAELVQTVSRPVEPMPAA